jgi:hypothetical protein
MKHGGYVAYRDSSQGGKGKERTEHPKTGPIAPAVKSRILECRASLQQSRVLGRVGDLRTVGQDERGERPQDCWWLPFSFYFCWANNMYVQEKSSRSSRLASKQGSSLYRGSLCPCPLPGSRQC